MLKSITRSTQSRQWLHAYARQEQAAHGSRELMSALVYVSPGRRYTREDMNTR